MRRAVIRLVTFVGGLFFLLEFLLPERAPDWAGGFDNPLTPHLTDVTNFVIIVGTMAFLLGPINLVRSHVSTILRRRKGLLDSAAFLVFLVLGVAAAIQHFEQEASLLYDVLFYGVLFAFGASSMAMLSFYLVSAAYRAFRMSSLDAGVMMLAATVVLLGQVPVGDWITYSLPEWLHLKTWAQWVMDVPNNAVQRAVLIGACGGAFAAGLRHWLGLGAREL